MSKQSSVIKPDTIGKVHASIDTGQRLINIEAWINKEQVTIILPWDIIRLEAHEQSPRITA